MTELIKIGNSQGVRIPKPLIEQAHLANKELEFKLVNNGLLIRTVIEPRKDWENQVKETLANYDINEIPAIKDKEWLA